MKLHTLYDVKRQIPVMNLLTDHSVSDCTMMEHIPYVPNSFYVFDKAYVSTPQLYNINTSGAFFVVRKREIWHTKLLKNDVVIIRKQV